MKKIVLTALAVVFGVIFAACDNPADGNGNDHTETTENINFGKITATSTQEEVTNIIKLSLELLQSQTQNIINKLTEYLTSLQAQLKGKQPGISYDILLDKINVVKSIITLEGQIQTAQQSRGADMGFESMKNSYTLLTGRAGDMLLLSSGKTDADKEIFVKKILTQQGAIELYERDIIGSTEKTTELNALDSDRKNITGLENTNGNYTYSLPDPKTNLYGLIGRLDSENKATLNTIWGQYAPLFEGQTEDLAQYAAVLGNARALGKTTTVPRSAAQYSAASLDVAEMVKEINAAPEMGR